MTEQEYDFIRTLENNNLNIMRRMSNIETLNNQNDIIKLHDDITKTLDIIYNLLMARNITTKEGVYTLEQMKIGFIEMLALLDELLS